MAYGIVGLDRGGCCASSGARGKAGCCASGGRCQAAGEREDVRAAERSATAVAERPVRRSRGKTEGDPRRSRRRRRAGSARNCGATLALDQAECQASQGEYGKAIDGLKAAEAENSKNADLPARLADLYLCARRLGSRRDGRGPRRESSTRINLQARWVQARLLELRGELEKSVDAWKWFVDRYNEKQAEIVTSAESLILVGQAAERYYRASARGAGACRLVECGDQRHL